MITVKLPTGVQLDWTNTVDFTFYQGAHVLADKWENQHKVGYLFEIAFLFLSVKFEMVLDK